MVKLVCVALMFILGACSPSAVVEKQLTPQERNTVRTAISDVVKGDTQDLYKRMPPQLAAQLPAQMARMRQALPAAPLDVALLDANWIVAAGGPRSTQMQYSVHGADGWAIVRAATVTEGSTTLLTTLYINRLPGDPASMNRFRLTGVGASQWLVLLAAVAAFVTTVAALVRIWRSNVFRRRWLWTVGTLFGVMAIRVNWTTGDWAFQPFYVQLFSAGAFKSPVYAPWIVSASLPLVAILALSKKRGPAMEPLSSDEEGLN